MNVNNRHGGSDVRYMGFWMGYRIIMAIFCALLQFVQTWWSVSGLMYNVALQAPGAYEMRYDGASIEYG